MPGTGLLVAGPVGLVVGGVVGAVWGHPFWGPPTSPHARWIDNYFYRHCRWGRRHRQLGDVRGDPPGSRPLVSRLVVDRATQRLKGAPITRRVEPRALLSGSLQSFLDTSDKVVLTEWLV